MSANMDHLANLIAGFHFLRPYWLLALIPFTYLLWLWWRKKLFSRSWRSVVDAQLLPHLLIGTEIKQTSRTKLVATITLTLSGLLAIIALAGPAWRKLEVPLFRQQTSLVVLLDLSRSMDATDIKPSRLQRAKLKLTDVLRQQKEGETALIVFAADAYVVSPLTTDANTIASQLNSFSTDLMPAQGSRLDLAVTKAESLLKQAGSTHGGVLLITDGVNENGWDELEKAVKHLRDAGHRLAIMGVGTTEGAPIPEVAGGGFLKSENGSIVLPKLDETRLAQLAQLGQGSYRRLSPDDSDLDSLLPALRHKLGQENVEANGMKSDEWRDEGPWLLLPLLLLGALAFRRGYSSYWITLAVVLCMQPIKPAHALEWDELWLNPDQRAQKLFKAGKPQDAAKVFNDRNWRASANYKAKNYQAALDDLKDKDSADALYNRGNTLAQMGQYQEAIAAYDSALKKNPKLDDASYNRDLLKKIMEQKKQQQTQSKEQAQQSKPSDPDQKGQQNQPSQETQPQAGSGSEKKPNEPGTQKSKDQDQNQKQDQAQADSKSQDQKSSDKNSSQQAGAEKKPENKEKSEAQKIQQAQQGAGQPSQNQAEKKQADMQWLQRIPDDPGGLWRNKFLYQYQQQDKRREKQPW